MQTTPQCDAVCIGLAIVSFIGLQAPNLPETISTQNFSIWGFETLTRGFAIRICTSCIFNPSMDTAHSTHKTILLLNFYNEIIPIDQNIVNYL